MTPNLFRTEKDALIIYNRALENFESMLGKNSTFSHQLERLGKVFIGKEFSGVFPVDDIYFGNDQNYCIFNLDTSDMAGSHWVALYKHNGKKYLYDSFGRKTKEIIKLKHLQLDENKQMDDELLKSFVEIEGNGIIDADNDAEQGILEENCGQRCLSWLYVVKYFGLKLALLI